MVYFGNSQWGSTVARVLVLNASYEPLSVVSTRRAAVLVLNEKAQMLEATDRIWRAERVQLPVPSVIRLNKFVRVPYGRTVPLTRNAVFARDGHRCQYCDGPAESIDHIVPRSRGGQHVWENVVAACRRCNLRKGSRFLEETGFLLNKRPSAPHTYGWVYARAGPRMDPLWSSYLLAESA
jgi:5-methylcytosine-specific restriction endonuclease McrA